METRANHVWVGAVTLLLLGGLALFFVWLARLGQGAQDEYDIFFKQSVAGLANGSQVVVENAGHDLFMASPDVVAGIVDFFSRRPIRHAHIVLPAPDFMPGAAPAAATSPESAGIP